MKFCRGYLKFFRGVVRKRFNILRRLKDKQVGGLMRTPWLICCYSCGVLGWSKTERSGDDPTRKLISQLPNKWTILELEGRAEELWLFCWYEPCCKLSCIVSRFEVTFKHSFEGFASKTIGDSLNNDTPETCMREVQDLENDRGIYKRKKHAVVKMSRLDVNIYYSMFLQMEYGFDWDECVIVWLSQSLDLDKSSMNIWPKYLSITEFPKSLGESYESIGCRLVHSRLADFWRLLDLAYHWNEETQHSTAFTIYYLHKTYNHILGGL